MKNTMLNPNFNYPSINYPSINYHLYHPYHSEYRLDQYHSIAISKMQASRPIQAISYKDSLMYGLSTKSPDDILKKNKKLPIKINSQITSNRSSSNSKNQPNYYEDNLAEVKNTNPTRIINRSNNHGSLSRISIENLIN